MNRSQRAGLGAMLVSILSFVSGNIDNWYTFLMWAIGIAGVFLFFVWDGDKND